MCEPFNQSLMGDFEQTEKDILVPLTAIDSKFGENCIITSNSTSEVIDLNNSTDNANNNIFSVVPTVSSARIIQPMITNVIGLSATTSQVNVNQSGNLSHLLSTPPPTSPAPLVTRFPKCVPAPTDPMVPIFNFSTDAELVELHARLSSRSFHSRAAQSLVQIQNIVSECCGWLQFDGIVKGGSVGRGTSVMGLADCELILVVPQLQIDTCGQWRPLLTKLLHDCLYRYVSNSNQSSSISNTAGNVNLNNLHTAGAKVDQNKQLPNASVTAPHTSTDPISNNTNRNNTSNHFGLKSDLDSSIYHPRNHRDGWKRVASRASANGVYLPSCGPNRKFKSMTSILEPLRFCENDVDDEDDNESDNDEDKDQPPKNAGIGDDDSAINNSNSVIQPNVNVSTPPSQQQRVANGFPSTSKNINTNNHTRQNSVFTFPNNQANSNSGSASSIIESISLSLDGLSILIAVKGAGLRVSLHVAPSLPSPSVGTKLILSSEKDIVLRKTISLACASQRSSFFARQGGIVKTTVRIIKWWSSLLPYSHSKYTPSDYLLELLVVHVMRNFSPSPSQVVRQRLIQSTQEMFPVVGTSGANDPHSWDFETRNGGGSGGIKNNTISNNNSFISNNRNYIPLTINTLNNNHNNMNINDKNNLSKVPSNQTPLETSEPSASNLESRSSSDSTVKSHSGLLDKVDEKALSSSFENLTENKIISSQHNIIKDQQPSTLPVNDTIAHVIRPLNINNNNNNNISGLNALSGSFSAGDHRVPSLTPLLHNLYGYASPPLAVLDPVPPLASEYLMTSSLLAGNAPSASSMLTANNSVNINSPARSQFAAVLAVMRYLSNVDHVFVLWQIWMNLTDIPNHLMHRTSGWVVIDPVDPLNDIGEGFDPFELQLFARHAPLVASALLNNATATMDGFTASNSVYNTNIHNSSQTNNTNNYNNSAMHNVQSNASNIYTHSNYGGVNFTNNNTAMKQSSTSIGFLQQHRSSSTSNSFNNYIKQNSNNNNSNNHHNNNNSSPHNILSRTPPNNNQINNGTAVNSNYLSLRDDISDAAIPREPPQCLIPPAASSKSFDSEVVIVKKKAFVFDRSTSSDEEVQVRVIRPLRGQIATNNDNSDALFIGGRVGLRTDKFAAYTEDRFSEKNTYNQSELVYEQWKVAHAEEEINLSVEKEGEETGTILNCGSALSTEKNADLAKVCYDKNDDSVDHDFNGKEITAFTSDSNPQHEEGEQAESVLKINSGLEDQAKRSEVSGDQNAGNSVDKEGDTDDDSCLNTNGLNLKKGKFQEILFPSLTAKHFNN